MPRFPTISSALISLVVLTSVTPFSTAQALIGHGVAPGDIEQSCSITVLRTRSKEFCSGTLTGETVVTTAKHCLMDSEGPADVIQKITVSCGYQGSKITDQTISTSFAEQFEVTEFRLAPDNATGAVPGTSIDLAQLTLPRKSQFHPVPTMDLATFKSTIFNQPTFFNCRVEGYGENNQGNTFELKSAQIFSFAYDHIHYRNYVEHSLFFAFKNTETALSNRNDLLSWFMLESREQLDLFLNFLRRNLPENFAVAFGDSGGGLYCKTRETGASWLWVGAIIGGSLTIGRSDAENNFVQDDRFLETGTSASALRSLLSPHERWDLRINHHVVIGDQISFSNPIFLNNR